MDRRRTGANENFRDVWRYMATAMNELEDPSKSVAGFFYRLRERLNQPADILPLVYFRVIFGILMAVEVYRYFNAGWIGRYYIEPNFLFKYFGFDWVQPLPGSGMYLHFFGLGVFAMLIIVGLWYRWVMPLFFFGFTYVFLLAQATYLNHFYLISLVSFVLIFLPANRFAAWDVRRKPELRLDSVPIWTIWLLRFQIAIPYIFGGIAKINGDWLRGEPMRDWLSMRTDFPFIGHFFTEEWVVYAFSYGGLFFDLLVIPLILWRPTRWIAVIGLVVFHIMNDQLFSIGIFPWFMLFATPIFFPDHWLRKSLGSLGAGLPAVNKAAQRTTDAFQLRPLGFAMLIGFVALNVSLPFRHHLYPGNVSWTEEGHRFAWHMKLRGKDGVTRFRVMDRQSEKEWFVNPADYLTERQQRKMPTRPDMILQFSHHLGRLWAEDGFEQVEVYAIANARLNDHAYQPLIFPDVDLMQETRTLWKASWIVPFGQRVFTRAIAKHHAGRMQDGEHTDSADAHGAPLKHTFVK